MKLQATGSRSTRDALIRKLQISTAVSIRYLRNTHQTFPLFFVSAALKTLTRRRSKRKQSFHRLSRRQISGLLTSTWLFTGVGLMMLLKEAAQATREIQSRLLMT